MNDPAIAGMPPIQAKRIEPEAPAPEPVEPQPAAAPDGGTQGIQEDTEMGDSKSVTAAKVKGAAFDMAGVLEVIRSAFKMPDAISDDMLAKLVGEALMGKPAEMPEEPEMPEAEKVDDKPAALPFESPEDAEKKKKLPFSVEAPAITLDAEAEKADRERIKALVARAYAEGKVTAATLEGAIQFAQASPDGFEAWVATAPALAPQSGQLVKASAADRSPKSDAQRLTDRYRNEAASRPHFTQRS